MSEFQLAQARAAASQGDWAGAARACQLVLEAMPGHVEAVCLLAQLARMTGNPAQATRLLQQELSVQGGLGSAELWCELAIALRSGQQLAEAAQALEQAALAAPNSPQIWNDLAAASLDLERFERSEECAQRALRLDPGSSTARINLASALRRRGHVQQCIRLLEEAVQLDPNCGLAHWNLSLAYLLDGRFAEGWKHYEWRSRAGQVALDHYPQPLWDGSPLRGRKLLIHPEQGLGDEILFASCYPELLAQAEHCVLVCDPRLVPLYRRSFAGATVIGHQRRKDRAPAAVAQQVDWQTPAGSLPRIVRRHAREFPRRKQFLETNPALVSRWAARYEALGAGPKVGISWRAGGNPSEHRKRTTQLLDWEPLFVVPDVHWVNLQYGDTTRERAQIVEAFGTTVHDWPEGDPLVDLDEFAARLLALDLVISVGNATAHLAGAVGQDAWVLLPQVPSWRWGLQGDASPWYTSLTLVRQRQAADWRPLLAEVAQRLRDRFGLSGTLHVGARNAPRPADSPGVTHDVNAALRVAIHEHAVGNLESAEAMCQRVLVVAPRQATALHLLGCIAHQTGRVQLAIDSLGRSLAVDERPEVLERMAQALWTAGEREKAIQCCRRAVSIDPAYTAARDLLRRWSDPTA